MADDFHILFFLGHKLKNQLQEKEPKYNHPMRTSVKQRGNQATISIWGVTFHVTFKSLRVTIRPSTLQVKSILLGISW
jgi:hypothetical protein